METPSPRLRSLVRWLLICCFTAALVPSVFCLARKVSAFGRADVLGLARARRSSGAPRRRIRRPFGSEGRRPAAPRRRRRGAAFGRSFALARRAFRRADRPQRRRAPDIPKRPGVLLGLALPLPLRRGPRVPGRGLRGGPALPAVAGVARLRRLRAFGRARPHAHAGAAGRRAVPRGRLARGRRARAVPRSPSLSRLHVPEAHASHSRVAPVRPRRAASGRDGRRVFRKRRAARRPRR